MSISASTNPVVPCVSVVMPVYNREAVLPFAIKSVLEQDFHNFELIIINDASDDGSASVIEYYQKRDARIKVINNVNNSRQHCIPWEPRNDGLQLATGEFIAYLDSDNTWRSNFLSIMLATFSDSSVQMAFCQSCNHYSSRAQLHQVLNRDKRPLVHLDEVAWTAAFCSSELAGTPGLDWYIDTNEMVHRASLFKHLRGLWNVTHPRRDEINRAQSVIRTSRRHNDQDLAERILDCFGASAIVPVAHCLVEYYYEGAPRPSAEQSVFKYDTAESRLAERLDQLNIDGFFIEGAEVDYRFSVGEISGAVSDRLIRDFRRYVALGLADQKLTGYGGTRFLTRALEDIAARYRLAGADTRDYRFVVPFDGGHNALYHAICVAREVWGGRRSTANIIFQVPAYPYWSICSAAGVGYVAIEAYSFDAYLEALEARVSEDTIAIIINTPHNPTGAEMGEAHIERLNTLARNFNIGLIVDIAYHSFAGAPVPLGLFSKERTLFCDSVSKSLGLPGLRLGFSFTSDERLATFLRRHKSASSLLPSAIKVDFVDYLEKQSDYRSDIAQLIRTRRSRVDDYIKLNPWPARVSTLSSGNGMFELLSIELGEFIGEERAEKKCASELLYKHKLLVTVGEQLFPPQMPRQNTCLLRLSFGAEASLEAGLSSLQSYLSSLLK
ncbi:aminotransferase class I/II-fold pyridoxal phosphate-dependent enzyme [Pseudomonas aeruginosa]|nr:aminotransferase class I/II-fold pyridoxal phosphate-dependent enzyme [Pseudomonas aeruginosa]